MSVTETEIPEMVSPEDFARRLGLTFTNALLLQRALTHRSYLNEHPEALEDNERLEFLGDAVLDFLVGAWLYNRFPEMSEGELTRLRSALVRTEQLADFAHAQGYGAALRLGRGESLAGGRQRTALLCATFEAMVGALYLDGGFEAVRRYVEPLLAPAVKQILASHREHDAKSRLQERVQAHGYPPPQYRTIAAYGPEHSMTFEVEVLVNERVLARGKGTSKQTAAQAAAQLALDDLSFDALGEAAQRAKTVPET
ncbi:MAG: ribonuclease III [Anaerolineales bacterium]|jgi:ribonuclease-3|nr:ribonuclease III [Anaerolineales bacterium]